MADITQEQLQGYIDAAITFYERVAGRLPGSKHVRALLAVAGIHESIERIKYNGYIVLDLRYPASDIGLPDDDREVHS